MNTVEWPRSIGTVQSCHILKLTGINPCNLKTVSRQVQNLSSEKGSVSERKADLKNLESLPAIVSWRSLTSTFCLSIPFATVGDTNSSATLTNIHQRTLKCVPRARNSSMTAVAISHRHLCSSNMRNGSERGNPLVRLEEWTRHSLLLRQAALLLC